MLRSPENKMSGDVAYTGKTKRVLVAIGADFERVVSQTHTSGKYHRHFTEYSAMHRGRFGY